MTATDDIAPPEPETKLHVQDTDINYVIDISRYSTYKKVLRITAYVLRFLDNCRKTRGQQKSSTLTVNEIQNVEETWLKYCQQTLFSKEIDTLNALSSKRLPLVKQLKLFIEKRWFSAVWWKKSTMLR
jgi:hypothetical protein